MERKLVLRAVFLFAFCLTRSLASGADGRASLHANKTLPRSTSTNEKLSVFRNESVELGNTVTLNCTKTKIAWDDMIFVIWKINLRDKECIIAVAQNDSDHDTCQDGKKFAITEETYQLIIPNFSVKDEGNYTCDISYQSGGWLEIIKVSAFARPKLSGWLEYEHGHPVAVCEATGQPITSIYWETPWNLSSPSTQASGTTGQGSTVISRLHLPRHAPYRNLTCVATASDLKHTKTRFSNFTFKDVHVKWPIVLVGVCATCSIVAILTGLYIMRKNLMPLSIFRKICCKPDIPAPNEEKPQQFLGDEYFQPHDPEELQPYASYVQRVNSIYNSSAELFNA
ncbi:cell surface glycoprotein CD200 receptor 1-A isoform X1 [Ictalurus punctatus]|uniref:Cell surface glycoprotein CD200 receptor 1-A isoform X1 n=1 Tax=Ictalurus punctatus TaxID=7998 RepID=A0A2D0R5N9_ICTPU|nr:cell surface glycoprotein CD200 receptor 1-A isoform X1 [Ictalurus punctatus]